MRSTSSQYCWTIQMLTSPIVMKCSTFSFKITGNRISPALKSIPAMHKNILVSQSHIFSTSRLKIQNAASISVRQGNIPQGMSTRNLKLNLERPDMLLIPGNEPSIYGLSILMERPSILTLRIKQNT